MKYLLPVALVACGAEPTRSPARPADPFANTVYAKLFQPGASWTFDVTLETFADQYRKASTQTAVETCTIAKVDEAPAVPGTKVAQMTCTKSLELEWTPTGSYVANATGLWVLGETVEAARLEPTTVKPEDVMIPAVPGPHVATGKLGEELTWTDTAVQVGDAWCVRHVEERSGEGNVRQLCFRADRGLVSATDTSSGLAEARFTLRR